MRAEDYARSLYKFTDITVAPIALEPILKALGVELGEEDFTGLSGLAFKRPEFKLIVVNRLLPIEQKRFAIAHELAHIVMPHKGGYQLCFPGKNPRMERGADRFAGELLMPESLVKKFWERYRENEEYRIEVLAEKFEVSKSAMAIRVRRLGLK